MGTELQAIGTSLATKEESFNLNLGIERLTIAIVIDIAYVLIIGFGREVVRAVGSDTRPPKSHLVSLFGLHNVTCHGIAVERHGHRAGAYGMYILRGAAIAEFQAVMATQGNLNAHTRLKVGIGLDKAATCRIDGGLYVTVEINIIIGRTSKDAEQMESQTCRKLQRTTYLPLIVEPKGTGPCLTRLFLMQQVNVPLRRFKLQVGGLKTIVQLVALSHLQYLTVVQRQVAYVAFHPVACVENFNANIIVEITIDEVCVCIVVVAKSVKPVDCSSSVAPLHVHQLVDAHIVTPMEERHSKKILRRKAEVKSHVTVVVVQRVVLIVLSAKKEQVHIGTATGEEKRRLSFLYRTLGLQLCRQQANGSAIVIALHVARAGVDVQHR